MFWIIHEFNRHKKNPFEQKYFPFYKFLGPETDIMVQLLEPETDVMVQFLAPEIVIMGKRNYTPNRQSWSEPPTMTGLKKLTYNW